MFWRDIENPIQQLSMKFRYDPLDPARPLFKCDFSAGSLGLAAGDKMKRLLQAGASRPWPGIIC